MNSNKLRYISEYNKKKYTMFQFRVKNNSTNVLDKLNKVESKNEYIRNLIENDISTLTIKQIKQIIKPILNKYGIYEIYLFGSYARGEANKDSDVDIYCERGKVKTIKTQIELEEELESSLDKKVDILFIGGLFTDISFKEELEKDMIKI